VMASGGDADGDGMEDIIVGSSSSDDTGNAAGKIYIISSRTMIAR
jgi:hypothetical protein